MTDIEKGNDRIDLPLEFESVPNKEAFLGVFEKINGWYGEDFSNNEKKIIKEVWNRGCNGFGKLNPMRIAILGNRIDTGIFEFRYPKFIDIDKDIIRKMNDANRQRKFREVSIKLAKKYNLFDDDIKTIELEFYNAYTSGSTPSFDKLDKKIEGKKSGINNGDNNGVINNSNETNQLQNNYLNNGATNTSFEGDSNIGSSINNDEMWPSDSEINDMLNLKVSPFFEEIRKEIFKHESFNNKGNGKYVEGFFNSCANEIEGIYKCDLENDQGLKQELFEIFIKHCYIISEGIEKSRDPLYDEIKDKIIDTHPEILEIYFINDVVLASSIDYSKYILSEEDEKNIDFLLKTLKGKHNRENLVNSLKKLKNYEERVANGEKLSGKDKQEYTNFKELFRHTKRLRKLEAIKLTESVHEYSIKSTSASIEYATGNIKDIKPIAIVENNKQISEYIYGDMEDNKTDTDMNFKMSLDDKKKYFKKLKQQRPKNIVFDFFNEDTSINKELVTARRINMKSVIANQKRINEMIKNLAIKEKQNDVEKEKIKKINIRRSCMICCFRAISQFFDTVNDNGENFASEFEINDVNKDIEFDKKTGVISMEGTIGANKSHVKLYYNTNDGTLEFDDFLTYEKSDGSESYTIGRGNTTRKKIDITLPKMSEMELTANTVNLNVIGRISGNMDQYNRIQGFAMAETIYLTNFTGILGVQMEMAKGLVKQFNEENILKQDIIKSIYSKFYNKNDVEKKLSGCLPITKGKEPEQFKMIQLIYNTIESYKTMGKYKKDTSQLLRFRNYINKFDEILTTDRKVIMKDELLRYLFANNLATEQDVVDSSKKIINRENENWTTGNSNDNVTYNYNKRYGNVLNHELNYHLCLELLSENKGESRIINLDEFENFLKKIDKIKSTGAKILDNKHGIFRNNYEQMVFEGRIPNLIKREEDINKSTADTRDKLNDLELDVNMNNT